MEQDTAFNVWARLLDAADITGMPNRERASKQLDLLTPVLPEPESWVAEGMPPKEEPRAEATALPLSGKVVFSVKLKVEPGQQRLTVRSWPVVPLQTRVERRQDAATHKDLAGVRARARDQTVAPRSLGDPSRWLEVSRTQSPSPLPSPYPFFPPPFLAFFLALAPNLLRA